MKNVPMLGTRSLSFDCPCRPTSWWATEFVSMDWSDQKKNKYRESRLRFSRSSQTPPTTFSLWRSSFPSPVLVPHSSFKTCLLALSSPPLPSPPSPFPYFSNSEKKKKNSLWSSIITSTSLIISQYRLCASAAIISTL